LTAHPLTALAVVYHAKLGDNRQTMISLAKETVVAYRRRMDAEGVPEQERGSFLKWVRFYLDFCHTYKRPAREPQSIGPFLVKLESKGKSGLEREQAKCAIELLLRRGRPNRSVDPAAAQDLVVELSAEKLVALTFSRVAQLSPEAAWVKAHRDLEGAIRMRNYSSKTLEVYQMWIRRFQSFSVGRAVGDLNSEDVKRFLTDLAVSHSVAGSTQNQAFNALLFFYRHVLQREFGQLDGVVRAKRRPYVPVVLSRREVDAVLAQVAQPYRLVVLLLYGCGLRLTECLELRVQCFNLDSGLLTIHDGKGQKDRTVPLPEILMPDIRGQLAVVLQTLQNDTAEGFSGTFLPRQFEKKFKGAGRAYVWQWFFPASTLTKVDGSEERRRYHLHDTHVQMAVKRAAEAAGITKRVTPHTFRHTYASHLLMSGCDLPTIQRLLGHGDIKTTMIYVQTVPTIAAKVAKSPLDMA
jgi:integron integrase